ncbi:hypothetical protein NEOC65_000882 [Neochlamydia sp. AcF65]|nr:hypothetical protein [Neochlamydia sp. AcF65]MBS4171573.1 hypothetical protein [Neochlamydia sp. AcF95]
MLQPIAEKLLLAAQASNYQPVSTTLAFKKIMFVVKEALSFEN